jgi:hypothetical protein
MNSARKYAAIAILSVLISGCAEKKAKTLPPPQAQAPAPDAGRAGALYPPPLTPSQSQPELPAPPPPPVVAKSEPQPAPQPAPANPKKTTTHRQKPSANKPATSPTGTSTGSDTPGTPAAPASGTPAAESEPPAEIAKAGEPAADTPIGQLTTGDAAAHVQTRKETSDLIATTENGLNSIKRTLSTQEQETATQIRTFLTKAKLALGSEDVDGAFTLATKAKVLLDELNKT